MHKLLVAIVAFTLPCNGSSRDEAEVFRRRKRFRPVTGALTSR
jgi:hypothetical protein